MKIGDTHNYRIAFLVFSYAKESEIGGGPHLAVHGGSFVGKEVEMREQLASVEDLNSKVFAKILSANHVATFSSQDKRRIKELQKLGLGISSEFGS